MGFLDFVLRGVKNEVEHNIERKAANAIGQAVTGAAQNIQSSTGAAQNIQASTGAPQNNQASVGTVIPNNNGSASGSTMIDGIDYSRNYNCNDAHFRDILTRNFPDMELREDIPLNQIIPGLNNAYQSVSFVLSQGGSPKVVVQLRYPHQATRFGSERQCKQNGIGYISLWRDYKNQEEYVVKRVKDALWN